MKDRWPATSKRPPHNIAAAKMPQCTRAGSFADGHRRGGTGYYAETGRDSGTPFLPSPLRFTEE
jgi:hypothetical protein